MVKSKDSKALPKPQILYSFIFRKSDSNILVKYQPHSPKDKKLDLESKSLFIKNKLSLKNLEEGQHTTIGKQKDDNIWYIFCDSYQTIYVIYGQNSDRFNKISQKMLEVSFLCHFWILLIIKMIFFNFYFSNLDYPCPTQWIDILMKPPKLKKQISIS